MSEDPFIQYKHNVEGSLAFLLVGKTVRFQCHWPLDRLTDEWMDYSNEFELDSYVRFLDLLRTEGRARLEGRFPGFIECSLLPAATGFYMTLGTDVSYPRTELSLPVDLPVGGLYPPNSAE
jgi:hypothetical protein